MKSSSTDEKHEPHFDADVDAVMLAASGVGYDEKIRARRRDLLFWMLLAGLPPDPVSRKPKEGRGRPPKRLSMRGILIECAVGLVRDKMRAGMSRDGAIDHVADLMTRSREPSARLTRQQLADAVRRGIKQPSSFSELFAADRLVMRRFAQRTVQATFSFLIGALAGYFGRGA